METTAFLLSIICIIIGHIVPWESPIRNVIYSEIYTSLRKREPEADGKRPPQLETALGEVDVFSI